MSVTETEKMDVERCLQECPMLFEHDPLDTSQQSFRLLNILPLSKFGTVECTVRNFTVTSSEYPRYIALSYECGSPTPVQKIILNGRPFQVGGNLYRFLHHAAKKLPWVRENIWIDAICINQKNVSERNHQVQQIAEFYRNAQTVYVWLGLKPRIEIKRRPWANFIEGPYGWRLPNDVARSSYWNRMWIVQELILARNPGIIYGTQVLPWVAFFPSLYLNYLRCGACKNAAEALVARLRDLGGSAGPSNFENRYRSSIPGKWSLFRLVLEVGHHQCSDNRDKIHALLGLASDGHKFQVDYNVSSCELFFQVLQKYRKVHLFPIALLQQNLQLRLPQLRSQLRHDTEIRREYVTAQILIPVKSYTLRKQRQAIWREPYCLSTQLPAALDGQTPFLTPNEMLCEFSFDKINDEHFLCEIDHYQPDVAVVLRRNSTGSYQYLALCEIRKKQVNTLGQIRKEYRLFHSEAFRSVESRDMCGCTAEHAAIMLPLMAIIELLELGDSLKGDGWKRNGRWLPELLENPGLRYIMGRPPRFAGAGIKSNRDVEFEPSDNQ